MEDLIDAKDVKADCKSQVMMSQELSTKELFNYNKFTVHKMLRPISILFVV